MARKIVIRDSTVTAELVDQVLADFGLLPKVHHIPGPQYRIKIPRPHPEQQPMIDSKAKRKIGKAGRRGGKTSTAAIIALKAFLRSLRVLYAVPTADQLQRFWLEVCAALAEPIQHRVFEKNETLHTIGLPGHISLEGFSDIEAREQRIRAKTAWNADTLRGDFADILILDEWQLMDEDAWHTVGAPMLIDNNGDAIFFYTPPSLASKSVSKASDKRHASKLFAAAEEHQKQARAKGVAPEWEVFHWRSYDNPHLSKEGLAMVSRDLTSLAYRQEIEAEDVNEAPGALWKRAWIEANRVTRFPELQRIVVGVDPPGGATECGIIVAGIGLCNCKGKPAMHGFIIEDGSTRAGEGPEIWSASVARVFWGREADVVVAEINFGGDMVAHTLSVADSKINVKVVHASRGKAVRAEPVAALAEKGEVHHVGTFEELEDELAQWVPGLPGRSPNRLDAKVWALTELMVRPDYMPASEGLLISTERNSVMSPMAWPKQF